MKEKSQKKIQVCKLGCFQVIDWRERLCLIAQVWYIKLLTRLWGVRDKIANFSQIHCLLSLRRVLSTKKTKPNREKWPASLRVMLELWTWAIVATFLVIFLCKSFIHNAPYLFCYKPRPWTLNGYNQYNQGTKNKLKTPGYKPGPIRYKTFIYSKT